MMLGSEVMAQRNRTVLIVDDDEIVLSALERYLRFRGFEVVTARDTPDALRQLREYDFDLAIVDLRLPTSSGIDLIRQVKRRQPKVKVALLSGYLSTMDAFEAARAGADVIVPKPIAPRELLKRLDHGMRSTNDTWDDTPSMRRAQRSLVTGVIADCNNNLSHAARKLRVARTTLWRILGRPEPKR
jgi:two-component system response regulator RegA